MSVWYLNSSFIRGSMGCRFECVDVSHGVGAMRLILGYPLGFASISF